MAFGSPSLLPTQPRWPSSLPTFSSVRRNAPSSPVRPPQPGTTSGPAGSGEAQSGWTCRMSSSSGRWATWCVGCRKNEGDDEKKQVLSRSVLGGGVDMCRCAGWPLKQKKVLRKNHTIKANVGKVGRKKKLVRPTHQKRQALSSTGFSDFIFVCGLNNCEGKWGMLKNWKARRRRRRRRWPEQPANQGIFAPHSSSPQSKASRTCCSTSYHLTLLT